MIDTIKSGQLDKLQKQVSEMFENESTGYWSLPATQLLLYHSF